MVNIHNPLTALFGWDNYSAVIHFGSVYFTRDFWR